MEVKVAKTPSNKLNKELNSKQLRHLDMFNYLTNKIGLFMFNDQCLYFNQTIQMFSEELVNLIPQENLEHTSTYIY